MALFDRKALIDLSAGEWIGGDKVPAFGDGKIKVRGMYCTEAQDAFAYKARRATKKERAPDGMVKPSVNVRHAREVLSEVCVLEAEGLPFTADQIRMMIVEGGYENLELACLEACRVAQEIAEISEAETESVNQAAVKN